MIRSYSSAMVLAGCVSVLFLKEHMGQAIASARMNGIAPQWSGQ